MTGTSKVDIRALPLRHTVASASDAGHLSEMYWEGRKIEGILMRGFVPELVPTNKNTKGLCLWMYE